MPYILKLFAFILVIIGLLVPASSSAQDFGGGVPFGTKSVSVDKYDFNALVANGRIRSEYIQSEREYEALQNDMAFVVLQNVLEKKANFRLPSAEDEGAAYAALKLYPFGQFESHKPSGFTKKQPIYTEHVTPKEEPTYQQMEGGGVTSVAASRNSRNEIWNSLVDQFEEVHLTQMGAIARIGMECTAGASATICEDGFQTIGTAFLVLDDGHLLTARHVFYQSNSSHAARDIRLLRVRFDAGPAGSKVTLAIDAVYMREGEDVALIKVSSTRRRPLLIASRIITMDEGPDDAVERGVSVGYPVERGLRSKYPNVWDSSSDVKLVLAPGYLAAAKIKKAVEWNGTMGEFILLNTASLAPGNSGSPIFNLDSGELIGLHVCGFDYKINVAISSQFLGPFAAELMSKGPTGVLRAPSSEVCSMELHAAAKDRIKMLARKS